MPLTPRPGPRPTRRSWLLAPAVALAVFLLACSAGWLYARARIDGAIDAQGARLGRAGWVAGARSAGPLLDGRGYTELSKQSSKVKPFTYRAVAPTLFQAVASQRLAPAPGPQEGRGGPQISPGDQS